MRCSCHEWHLYVYLFVDITIEAPSSAEERAMLDDESRDGESDTEGICFGVFLFVCI